jgi:hypothetical protein
MLIPGYTNPRRGDGKCTKRRTYKREVGSDE